MNAVGYSFASTKPVSTGEGGLMLYRDATTRSETLRWGVFGVGDDRGPATVPGLNAQMSELLLPALATIFHRAV